MVLATNVVEERLFTDLKGDALVVVVRNDAGMQLLESWRADRMGVWSGPISLGVMDGSLPLRVELGMSFRPGQGTPFGAMGRALLLRPGTTPELVVSSAP